MKGAGTHLAKATDTALDTMRSVEYVIQNLDDTAATVERSISEARKRIFDLQVQTAQPFEYEARLITLSRRQDEIEDALDLTKGQAAPQLDAQDTNNSENLESHCTDAS